VSATRFETDGFRGHSAAERTGFNGKLKFAASADTRVSLVLNSVEMPDVQDPLGLTRAELAADPRQASPAALAFDTRKTVRQSQVGAILEQRLGANDNFKLTGWTGTRSTVQFQAIPVAAQTPITHPGGVIDLDRDYQGVDGQWTHKARLFGAPLAVTAGLSTDRLQEHRRGFQNFVGSQLGVQGALRRDEDNRVRSLDEYVQGVWTSGDFSVTAGARHASVKFDSRDHFIRGANGDDSGATRFSATTPVLGLVWHASDTLNLYASAGRGFETPTFNELAYRPGGEPGLNFGLRAATSRQFEVGAKAELGPDWRGTVALFQARTRDEIVVLSNTGGRSTFQNAGSTRRRGLEAGLDGALARDLTLALALTWLEATYGSDFLTCVATPCAVPTVLVSAGNRIPGIPRANGYAELAWRHRPWGLETALEARATGRIAVDDRNTDAAAGSVVFSLRASLSQEMGRWMLREFVRVDNVADRRTVGSVIVNEGNGRFFEPAPGRTWLAGVRAAYKF
jgi:iron complex outermembrane receptor protein